MQQAFGSYYLHNPVLAGRETADNGEYLKFKRWEAFVEPRLDEKGHFPAGKLAEEWNKEKDKKHLDLVSNSANWTLIGPDSIPGGGGGMGRTNVLRFQPGNPQILWLGSANGGLWKSTNAGTSWKQATGFLPSLGIADIAINPKHPDTLYIATGDGYGYEAGSIFWGGTYTAGIMKSTDGGLTWNSTGFSFIQAAKNIVQRLVVNPVNPSVLLAATRTGIWRSADAGTTWANVLALQMYDIEINTANDSIVYCSGSNSVYRSPDQGLSWTAVQTGLGANNSRMSIAVTAANPNCLYVLNDTGACYKSLNGGNSFQLMSAAGPTANFYGYYDCVLSVSQQDPNKVVVGGLQVASSTDGGITWKVAGNWSGWPAANYVHADNHDLEFYPGNDSLLFSCDDGGLFRTNDLGQNWTDLSNGLSISQMYRMGGSASIPDLIYTGLQDNGVIQLKSKRWNAVYLADGMECIVDYSNPNHVLISSQNGDLQYSIDGGVSFSAVAPSTKGGWTIPIVMDSKNPALIWAGYEEVYQSIDGGLTWSPVSVNLLSSATANLNVLAVAPSSNTYIYAGSFKQLHMTANGGGVWKNIGSGLPLLNNAITALAVSSSNPLDVWVTLSGYQVGEKVYRSSDGGASWVNYSGTLPNVPADAILYENGSTNKLYLGTDFGVYYRDSTMSDWQPFNTGLPNVIVNELEINYKSGRIRAATYGRGLWESPLPELTGIKETESLTHITLFPNPGSGVFEFTDNSLALYRVTVYSVTGQELISKPLSVTQNGVGLHTVDLSTLPAGVYSIRLEGHAGSSISRLILTP
jgi:photosystem II stability/assembly factor-like uncharacterized protein